MSTQHVNPPARRIRGRRGALANFVDTLLDVKLAVLDLLGPAELVSLSQTSKELRRMLMDNQRLWKAARLKVEDLPERPVYLSEPQYAHLMFSNVCHNCGRRSAIWALYCWNVRYCRLCKSLKEVDVQEYAELLEEIRSTTAVAETPFYVLNDTVHIPEVEKFRAEWDALEGDPEGRTRLVNERVANIALRRKFQGEAMDWERLRSYKRKAEIKSIKAGRLENIKARIQAEGLLADPNLIDDTDLARQPFAKKIAPLTDNGWQCIRNEVKEFIELRMTQRLRRERALKLATCIEQWRPIFKDWAEEWDAEDYDPDDLQAFKRVKLGDFLMMDEIKAVTEDSAEGSASGAIAPGRLKLTLRQLESMVERWYTSRREDLKKLLVKAIPGLPTDVAEPAELAIALFDCADPRCGAKFMQYPDVLDHRCFHIRAATWRACGYSASYEDIVQEHFADRHEPIPWERNHVRVNTRVVARFAGEIVRVCGLDPFAATPRAMDRRGARMTCGTCKVKGVKKDIGLEVFDWRRALHHQASEVHREETEPCRWVVLPEEVSVQVREYEDKLRAAPGPLCYERESFACARKRERCFRAWYFDDMLEHVRSEHGVEGELVLWEHYFARITMAENDLLHGTFLRLSRTGDVEVFSIYKKAEEVKESKEDKGKTVQRAQQRRKKAKDSR
ncbi:hypothetical protein OH77DRAFT_1416224 [Trametes cingulata]|nr:hypothetical protein OH77DRAFT_1416224 [Trametes cingulata]